MSMNFTPLKYSNNSSLNKFNTDYISTTSPNKDQTQSNNFNHFSRWINDNSYLRKFEIGKELHQKNQEIDTFNKDNMERDVEKLKVVII